MYPLSFSSPTLFSHWLTSRAHRQRTDRVHQQHPSNTVQHTMDSRAFAAAGGALVGGIVVALLLGPKPSQIERIRTDDPRSSAIVKHNGVVMISGQVRALFTLVFCLDLCKCWVPVPVPMPVRPFPSPCPCSCLCLCLCTCTCECTLISVFFMCAGGHHRSA